MKTESAKKIIYRNIKEVHSKITEKSETCKILDEKTRKQKRKEESLKRQKLYDRKNSMIKQKKKL